MNKRLLAILLVVVGLLAIIGVLWFFFFNKPKTTLIPQQPGQNTVTPSVPFDPSTSVPTFEPPTGTPPDPNSAEEKERQAQEKLRRIAMNYAGRLGTYSADDGFEAIRDSQAIATTEFQPRLASLRAQLLNDHPVGSHWSQEARSVTSAIVPTSLPVFGKTSATINVQAQRTVGSTQDYLNIAITLTEQNGNWLVSNAVFTTFER